MRIRQHTLLTLAQIFVVLGIADSQNHVPPGVNPQHYQQQPPAQPQYQQQQQQQQQQFQQPQYQQQQAPPQQAPQFQQQGQQPPQHHGTHQAHAPGKILDKENLEHEKDHLGEHLHAKVDTSKMTEQELQFHYFKMHDSDNNNMLDGCELIKSLIHWHDDSDSEEAKKESKVSYSDEMLTKIIDEAFDLMDADKNGFLDWVEYKKHM